MCFRAAAPFFILAPAAGAVDKRDPKQIAPAPGHPERIDYEYERNGTAAIFMFTEPLGGWRRVSARERRTRVDWAHEIKHLHDVDFPQAEKVILVCDNLNTHKIASLYEAFEPHEARRLVKRVELHHTTHQNMVAGSILQKRVERFDKTVS